MQGWYVITIKSFWWDDSESELRNEISTEKPQNAHRRLDDSLRAPYSLNPKGFCGCIRTGGRKSKEIDKTPWLEFQRPGDVTSSSTKNTCVFPTAWEIPHYSELWSVGPTARSPGFKSQVCHFLAVWAWASYLTALCLSFCICLVGLLWGLNKLTHGK